MGRYLGRLLAGVVVITSTACSVFGVESVEEAPYKLIIKDKQFEIREYSPSIVAETRVDASFKQAGREAFGRLFDYISGENEAAETVAMTAPVSGETSTKDTSESIEMTAPVSFKKEGESWTYNFVLPRTFTLETAPKPLNSEVTLAEIPQKRVATIRFRGLMSDSARAENAKALLEWIKSQGLEQESELRWAGYNPPWTLPPFRRNEVLVDVSERQESAR